MGDRIRCPSCGLPVPNVPSDAMYEETLCNICCEEWENEQDGSTTEKKENERNMK